MAVPVVESSAKFADSSNSTSRTINKPSGTASGDWLVLVVSMDGIQTINTPTGFTLVRRIDEPGGSVCMSIFKRKADGTEGSTFTITSDNEYATGMILRISGCDSTDCIDIISTGAGELGKSPNVRCPNAWSECADSLVLRIGASDGGVVSLTAPSGHTSIDYQAGGTSGTSLAMARKDQATAGYTDSAYFTSGKATEEFIGATLVIRSTSTASAYPDYPVIRAMSYLMPPTSAGGTFDKPYGTVENDLLLSIRTSDVAAFTSTLSGFTTIHHTSNAGAAYLYTDYKKATGAEGTGYTAFTSTAGAYTGALLRIVNADTTSPFDTSSEATGNDAAPTASTITPANNNSLLIWAVGADDDDAAYDSGYPSGWTGMFSVGNQEASDSSAMLAIKSQTTAAATGSVAGTLDAAEEWCAHLIAIKTGAASGNVSANLTGVSGTGSAGTITATGDSNVTPTGVSATGSAGTITATGTATADLTGVAGTGAAGDITVDLNTPVDVTGVSATGQAGTLDATGGADVSLTGVSATGAAGDISVDLNLDVPLTGVEATGSAGDISPTGDANVTLDGVSATGSAGTLDATDDANVTLTGVSATGQAGDITVDLTDSVSVDLTGVSATGSAGDISPTGDANVTLDGVEGTGAAGDISVTVDVSVTLTGVEAVGTAGDLDATVTGGVNADLTGVSATGQVGDITVTGDANVTLDGVEATGSAGDITATTGTGVVTSSSGSSRLKKRDMARKRRAETPASEIYDVHAEIRQLKNQLKPTLKLKVEEKSATMPVKASETAPQEPILGGVPISENVAQDVAGEPITATIFDLEAKTRRNRQKKQAVAAAAALLAEVESQQWIW